MDENLETFSLLWLDTSVDSFVENLQAYQQLRTIINHIRTFKDVANCDEYIRRSSGDHIVLIVSEEFCQEFISSIQHLRQVRAIYVYCFNEQKQPDLVKQYTKVKAVVTELSELIVRIKDDHLQMIKIEEPLAISVLEHIDGEPEKSSLDINGTYLHFQLLIDVLIRMKPSLNDKDELIEACKKEYQNNSLQGEILGEFEHTYCSDQVIWWYTRESFLYRLLNKALRTQNIEILFLFRFFIRDIHQQLTELKHNQFEHSIRAYRGQLLGSDELALLANSLGKIISMNSFFSTSLKRDYVVFILGDSDPIDSGLKRVIFEIDADPSVQNIKPFADISEKSFFGEEQEVLFMAGSIFRVTEIKEENGLWIIGLVLCKKEENDLKPLYEYMKNKKTPAISLLSLGTALSVAGKFDQAERFFRRMLRELPADDYSNLVESYQGLAVIFAEREDFEISLTWNQKALDVIEENLLLDHSDIAFIHNNMGIVYWKIGQLERALESLTKALNIFKKSDDEDSGHQIAACYTNIALISKREKKYEEALDYFYASLELNEKLLPSDHHNLAETHTNIGIVFKCIGQFDLALEHYDRALSISLRSLPSEHYTIAMIYCNMANIYEANDDLNLALSTIEKASTIFHKTLPPEHSNVIRVASNLERVKSKLNNK